MNESARPPTPRSPQRLLETSLPSHKSPDDVPSLPLSSTASHVDTLIKLPFLSPKCSLVLQSKRVLHVSNALMTSKLATRQPPDAYKDDQ
ncbi:unnamed protein product [Peronospora destructor]|uniref:Uncharacterized protein n=1 Tax=Peronospora destructor TaxID=86335 RepID=A0AAV0V8Q2_9STRA|nr:unnamed protein product [Peronospora destructor]